MPRRSADGYVTNPEELPTVVYVARCEGRLKIGIASDAGQRARRLTTTAGVPVTIAAERRFSTRLSALAIERTLHKRFRRSRLEGEWFRSDLKTVVRALDTVEDPEIHIADWRPGMPPEVASAGIIERWTWCEDNGLEYSYRP